MKSIFPALENEGYEITSAASIRYNCVAWAAGDDDNWWYPDPNGFLYWPSRALREWSTKGLIAVFRTLGYKKCENGDFDKDYEKVVIYVLLGIPKHAARQMPDGRWTSKLGEGKDIIHTLLGLQGTEYGMPTIFLRRRLKGRKKEGR